MLARPVAFTVLLLASGLPAAADSAACPPRHHRHFDRHLAKRHHEPRVVYGRLTPRALPPQNYEDNNQYDGADLPRPGARVLAYGQAPSWLDGYGTRPVVYGAYGTSNVYGGSAQVMPFGLPPAGGLAVYSPGSYGPGPSIIAIPPGY